jgi:hypothetical protein
MGRRMAAQLHAGAIRTVLDLAQLDPGTVRQHWPVVPECSARELRGQPWVELVIAPGAKQQIPARVPWGIR